ncbi:MULTISPECIES: class I SAM-dependent methyltransferase [Streptomyces]|uniref:Class I SAM-dependent methyltransferase n=1 Tax=Streptomyces sudanensis TaxID=436397 RepID=A0ABY4TH10_9ACTN|nr:MULTISPECIES: class I SAM-dependent methyltransferase [Streptomyces]URN18183.1 class I SAM-dependent methyltransferase [Streptomyces sudanensis]
MRERRAGTGPGTVDHPLFARLYARLGAAADRGGFGELRRELLDGLSGRIVEVGAGNGLNFPHYPAAVSGVVAVEPDRVLRRLAAREAPGVRTPVDVVAGTAEALPLGDGAFDGAVVSLVLCSVRDVRGSLAELRRVLRPGGELRFLEHGLAPGRVAAAVQRGVDATVWPRLFGGCHTARDPLAGIGAAGFEVVTYRRLRIPERGVPLPASPIVLGVARRPPSGAA